MKPRRQGGAPAVSDTTPLASDTSMPPIVDEATAEVTTEVAQALAAGAIDVEPAPVIDTGGTDASAIDAVAIATADAQAAAPAEPLVPVPGTVALPADQLTPAMPVSRVVEEQGAVATFETDADLALATVRQAVASLGLRIDIIGERLHAIEGRLAQVDSIVLSFDDNGNVTGIDAPPPDHRLAELRRDILGVGIHAAELGRRMSSTHRAFPVESAVIQDGRNVRPNSRDRVRLTEAEHRDAVLGGIVVHPWDEGDPIEDDA